MSRLLAATIASGALVVFALAGAGSARAQTSLGTAESYAILGGQEVTNTNVSNISGDVGVWPGNSIVGFPPGIVTNGVIHNSDAEAQQAQSDLTVAFTTLMGAPTTSNLSGQDLGGLTLTSGVYAFDSDAFLTGTVTLDGQGNPNSVFIFKVSSAFTTASSSAVALINGAQGGNVFFVVGSSATLDSDTEFAGKILALTSITLITNANINCGAALARNGTVTLDDNDISICTVVAATFTTVLGTGATANAQAVAAALDLYVTNGGTLPAGFQNLLDFLSPDELAAAFNQLSGQTGAGAAPTGMQAMDSYLSQVFDLVFEEDQAPENAPNQPPGTVRALGYADEKGPTAVDAAFASFNANPAGRTVWASAYGSRGTIAGDASIGSSDRFQSAFGVAAGYDYRVAPDTKVGVSFGVGRSNYNVAGGLGGGTTDMLQLAIYGKKDFGAAYLAAALAYAYNSVSTTRYAPLVTTDSFAASFGAHDLAARVEAGVHYDWFTPYAALSVQAFYTPAYAETSTPPGSPFALAYDDNTAYSARTELGIRLARSIAVHNGKTLKLHGRLAWAHDFSSAPSVVASFQALPGAPFTVTGAAQASNSLLVTAGADIGFMNGFSIGGQFDGAFSSGTQSYGGRGRVRYSW